MIRKGTPRTDRTFVSIHEKQSRRPLVGAERKYMHAHSALRPRMVGHSPWINVDEQLELVQRHPSSDARRKVLDFQRRK